jgi:tetratricopeptide (TPR) repeat protein
VPEVPVVTIEDVSPPNRFYPAEELLAALFTFVVSFGVFFYTMCPSVTLQDSGELVTGAYRFGVPHPPGYPLWAFLGWVWRHLVPVGDPAWQLCLFSVATGAAVTALTTFLIRRTSLVVLRSLTWHDEPMPEPLARVLSLSLGVSCGLMFAFNRGVWLWSCVPEMRILSVFMFLLTATLFIHWLWRPGRLWLLYLTLYVYGLGMANHQTLLVMIVPLGAGAFALGLNRLLARKPVSFGFGTVMPCMGELIAMMAASLVVAGVVYNLRAWLDLRPEATSFSPGIFPLAVLAPAAGLALIAVGHHVRWLRWRMAAGMVLAVVLGGAFYFYMPIAASTNPPMNWGFSATREGFLHHITRGQYQQLSMSTPFGGDFWIQLSLFIKALVMQYTLPLFLVAFVSGVALIARFGKLRPQGRVAMLFIWAAYATTFLGLMMIINPGVDLQNWEINIKFFAPAHGFYAVLIAWGMAMALSYAWTHLKSHALGNVAVAAVCLAMLALPLWPYHRNWAICEQRGHDFGYQFGFRMFNPGHEYPPMERDAVLFGGTDPGRFVPTYMIFCESFAKPGNRYVSPWLDQAACTNFDRRDVYIITQNALADNTYMNYIRDHYDFSRPDAGKPATIEKFAPWQRAIFRFAWHRMDRAITYPREPIHIPSPDDSNMAFRQYIEDIKAKRIPANADVKIENGRVSVQGVGGVMAINGILAKWIFDKNKDKHAFYVEESYVIPWMYPYLTPAGVIMKINKDPVPGPQEDLKAWQEIVTKDVSYWTRLIAEFEKRPEFRRDRDAQKSFSKLRCAIAGIYEFRGILQMAEAAYQQAVQLSPESPEPAFRLANLYGRIGQLDKAVAVLTRLQTFDPYNKNLAGAIANLESARAAQAAQAAKAAAPAPQPAPVK